MRTYLFATFIILTTVARDCNCNHQNLVPACIQQKIEDIKAQPKWNPPAEVHAYQYKGKTVYYFTSNCCDQYNVVYDADCNYLCAPDGGYTGRGDGKCADFKAAAEHIRLVWKDPR
jgi:hypothetical protein